VAIGESVTRGIAINYHHRTERASIFADTWTD
jgi:hypothetical protein